MNLSVDDILLIILVVGVVHGMGALFVLRGD